MRREYSSSPLAIAALGCVVLLLFGAIITNIVVGISTLNDVSPPSPVPSPSPPPPLFTCASVRDVADDEQEIVSECAADIFNGLCTEILTCETDFEVFTDASTLENPVSKQISCDGEATAALCELAGGEGAPCQCFATTCERLFTFEGADDTPFAFDCFTDIIIDPNPTPAPPTPPVGDDDIFIDVTVVLPGELGQVERELERIAVGQLNTVQERVMLSYEEFNSNQFAHENAVVALDQSSFDKGSVQALVPVTFIFRSNVTFAPNVDNDMMPTDAQRASGEFARASGTELGFPSPILVLANDVLIDLAGYTLEGSPEWNAKMPFGSLVLVASAPFVRGEGPANFGQSRVSPSRVVIRGGRLGRNPHHCIHSPSAGEWVYVRNITCDGHRIAGIALNGMRNSMISDVVIGDSDQQVPMNGAFSQIRFLLPFLRARSSRSAIVEEARARLQTIHDDAIADVIADNRVDKVAHPEAYDLVAIEPDDNGLRQVDGNGYGLADTNVGTGAPPFDAEYKEEGSMVRVLIKNVTIGLVSNRVVEVVALLDADDQPFLGPVGDVIRFDKALATRKIDALLNGQLALALAQREFGEEEGLHKGTLSVPDSIVTWYQQKGSFDELEQIIAACDGCRWARSGDRMLHFDKGATGIRQDSSRNVVFLDVHVTGVHATGLPGDEIVRPGEVGPIDASTYTAADFGHPEQGSRVGYGGADARCVLLSASVSVNMTGVTCGPIRSDHGRAIIVDTLEELASVRRLSFPRAITVR